VETLGGTQNIVSSQEINGKKIKVDFEVPKVTGTSDTRLAMLYVTISIYEMDEDISTFFTSHPNYFNYYDFDDENGNGIYDEPKEYKDSSGTTIIPPEPVFQQRNGIYLVNIRNNIDVVKSRSSVIKKGVTDGALKIVKEEYYDHDDENGNPVNLPIYYTYDEMTNTLKSEYENKKSQLLEGLEKDDQLAYTDSRFALYSSDVASYIDANPLDYTGSVLRCYDTRNDG
jgi:hypothetical protein